MINFSQMSEDTIYRVSWKTSDGDWWHTNVKRRNHMLCTYESGIGPDDGWVVHEDITYLVKAKEEGSNCPRYTETVNRTVTVCKASDGLVVNNELLSDLYDMVSSIAENVAIGALYEYDTDIPVSGAQGIVDSFKELTVAEKSRISDLLKTYQ